MDIFGKFKKSLAAKLDEVAATATDQRVGEDYDSEIERLLGWSLKTCIALGALRDRSVRWHPIEGADLAAVRRVSASHAIVLCPQVRVDHYRVDFLAAIRVGECEDFIAIECDGHAFHERTPEQAARDKARDRHLQNKGIAVYRYTGSEIWRDPMRVADEIIDAIELRAVDLMTKQSTAA